MKTKLHLKNNNKSILFGLLKFAFIAITISSFGQNTITFDDENYTNVQDLNNFNITSNGTTFNFSSSSSSPGFQYQTGNGFCTGTPTASGYVEVTGTSIVSVTITTSTGSEFDFDGLIFINDFVCFGSTFHENVTVEGFKNGSSSGSISFIADMERNVVDVSSNMSFSDVDTIVVTAVDGGHDTLGIDDFIWNVAVSSNMAPMAIAPTVPTVVEDATNVVLDDTIQITDADAGDIQTATFTITGGTVTLGTTGISFGGGGNGSASFTAEGTLAAINTALDAATFTPTAGLNGTNAGGISFVTNDGMVDSNIASITFDITPVNDVPSFTIGVNQMVDEDAGAQTISNFVTAIEDGDPEVTQVVTFNVSAGNTALFSTQPAIDATGSLMYTPATDAVGTTTVTVSLSDNGGGTDTSANQTFDITINVVNDTPVVITSITDDTGISTADFITSDTTPTVVGTAEPGSTIFLTANGTSSALFSISVITDMSGNFSFPFPALFGNLPEGTAVLGAISTLNGVTLSSMGQNVTIDTTAPVVQSISLVGTPSTIVNTVDYTVTFNESVSNITTDDFELTFTGSATGNIVSVSAASGTSVTVTIGSLLASSIGTVRLDFKSGTDIEDLAGNSGTVAFTGGDVHSLDFTTLSTVSTAIKEGVFTFANPVNEILKITSTVAINNIEVYNLSGALVAISKGNAVDVSALETGMYIVRINTKTSSVTKKIVKK